MYGLFASGVVVVYHDDFKDNDLTRGTNPSKNKYDCFIQLAKFIEKKF